MTARNMFERDTFRMCKILKFWKTPRKINKMTNPIHIKFKFAGYSQEIVGSLLKFYFIFRYVQTPTCTNIAHEQLYSVPSI